MITSVKARSIDKRTLIKQRRVFVTTFRLFLGVIVLSYVHFDVTQNYFFFRLQLVIDTRPNESTNQSSLKVPKVVKPTNKKRLLKTLGTSVIHRPLFFPSCLRYHLQTDVQIYTKCRKALL